MKNYSIISNKPDTTTRVFIRREGDRDGDLESCGREKEFDVLLTSKMQTEGLEPSNTELTDARKVSSLETLKEPSLLAT